MGSARNTAQAMIVDECKDLSLGDMQVLAEWKLYQVHKTAGKTDKNRRLKRSSIGRQALIAV